MGLARIVSGCAKGRSVYVPKGVRPTSALCRRRILDSFEPLSSFADVLDLYAGAGALSAELLSRGVGRLVAVEQSRRVAAVWKQNIERFGFLDRAEIMVRPVGAALDKLLRVGRTFDLVIADPPYGCHEVEDVLSSFAWNELLKTGAILVIEHSKRQAAPRIQNLTHRWSKRIGDTRVHAFER